MQGYYEAKRLLFRKAVAGSKKALLVINTDDTWGKRLQEEFEHEDAQIVTFGMGANVDVQASNPKYSLKGTEFHLKAAGREFLVRTPLVGSFNVYNVLAALAAARGVGLNVREAVKNLAELPQVPGRLEFVSETSPIQVFVDYAHTPDALENACRTLKGSGRHRLITVFGCGGDRDVTKRPLMAQAAENHSDACLVTNRLPR